MTPLSKVGEEPAGLPEPEPPPVIDEPIVDEGPVDAARSLPQRDAAGRFIRNEVPA